MGIGIKAACVEEDQKLSVFCCTLVDHRNLKKQVMSEFGIGSQQVLILQIDEVPRNSSGKILYGNLREHVLW